MQVIIGNWYLYGQGWSTSYGAYVNINVSRNLNENFATVNYEWAMQSYGGDTAEWIGHIEINGADHPVQIRQSGYNAPSTIYYKTGSFTVSVGSAPGKITGKAYATLTGYESYNGGISPVVNNWSIDYAGQSYASIISASNVTLAENGSTGTTIVWDSGSTSYSFKMEANCNGVTTYRTVTGISGRTSQILNFPNTFINAINNGKTATCAITLTTYNGSTSVGSSSTTINLTVPNDINPEVTINDTIKHLLYSSVGCFPNKYCTILDAIQVDLVENIKYGASAASRLLIIDGETFSDSSAVSSTLTQYGIHNISASITDTRGNSSPLTTKTVNVYWYFNPQIKGRLRKGASGYLLDISGRIAYVDGANTGELYLAVKNGPNIVGPEIILNSYVKTPIGENEYSKYYPIEGTFNIPDDYRIGIENGIFTFELKAKDAISSSYYDVSSGKTAISLYAGGKGVALFKEADKEGFEVQGDFYLNGMNIYDIIGSGGGSGGGSNVTESEKTFWNNKVTAYRNATGSLVLTKENNSL